MQRQLFDAADDGDALLIDRLAHGGTRLDQRDERELVDPLSDFVCAGGTALHRAAFAGRAAAVDALARHGANLEARDERSLTALHVAAHFGHTGAVVALLRAGAAGDASDADGKTAAHHAAAQGHEGVLDELHHAGIDLAVGDAKGETPAHAAARQCAFRVLRHLGQLGLLLGATDSNHKTVLDAAAEHVKLYRTDVISLDTVRMLVQSGVALTADVVASLLADRDEGSLSSNLRSVRLLLQHGVLYAKNPIWAALVVSAALRQRSLTAQSIKADLQLISKRFSRTAAELIRSETLDDERLAVELLTAPEKQHRTDTAFEVGPLAAALRSHDGDFIAQPVVQRLVDTIWYGGHWSLVECKRLAHCLRSSAEFYRYVCVAPPVDVGIDGDAGETARPSPSVSAFIPIYRELAHPSQMRRVAVVQFWYETLLGLVFIAISIDKIVSGAYHSTNTDVLLIFIIGNMLFEVGQISEGFWSYVADVWNRMDFTIYVIFGVWMVVKYGYESTWYWTNLAQRVLALNGFLMCFRLLHVVRLNRVLGPLVLMVLKMFSDLVYFLAIFFILLAGFSVTMHAMFHNHHGYYTMSESFFTLFVAALGEFDFESLQISAEYGKYDSNYWMGSLLLVLYLLLATVLLLNLVVAKFSSTYQRIEAHSYQEWCFLVAQVVEDYHQSKEMKANQSPLCAVPPPLNLLTAAAAVPHRVMSHVTGKESKLIKYCANLIFAVCVNFPCCVTMHVVAPVVSLLHMANFGLSGGFRSLHDLFAAVNFVLLQFMIVPASPLLALYYIFNFNNESTELGIEGKLNSVAAAAASSAQKRKSDASARLDGGGDDSGGKGSGGGGGQGGGGGGSGGAASVVASPTVSAHLQQQHQHDALVSRLFPHRVLLVEALREGDEASTGFVDFVGFWRALRSLHVRVRMAQARRREARHGAAAATAEAAQESALLEEQLRELHSIAQRNADTAAPAAEGAGAGSAGQSGGDAASGDAKKERLRAQANWKKVATVLGAAVALQVRTQADEEGDDNDDEDEDDEDDEEDDEDDDDGDGDSNEEDEGKAQAHAQDSVAAPTASARAPASVQRRAEPLYSEGEARLVFELLLKSQQQGRKKMMMVAAARKDLPDGRLEYVVLEHDLRPFVPRIPVAELRRIVHHQDVAETLTNVYTSQHQLQQQQMTVQQLIKEQQSDLIDRVIEMQQRQSQHFQMGHPQSQALSQPRSQAHEARESGGPGDEGERALQLPAAMEAKVAALRSEMQQEMQSIHAKVERMQAQNAEILGCLERQQLQWQQQFQQQQLLMSHQQKQQQNQQRQHGQRQEEQKQARAQWEQRRASSVGVHVSTPAAPAVVSISSAPDPAPAALHSAASASAQAPQETVPPAAAPAAPADPAAQEGLLWMEEEATGMFESVSSMFGSEAARNWEQRYVRIRAGRSLVYYEYSNVGGEVNATKLGSVALRRVTELRREANDADGAQDQSERAPHEHRFRMVARATADADADPRTYRFAAESAELRDEWLGALQALVATLRQEQQAGQSQSRNKNKNKARV